MTLIDCLIPIVKTWWRLKLYTIKWKDNFIVGAKSRFESHGTFMWDALDRKVWDRRYSINTRYILSVHGMYPTNDLFYKASSIIIDESIRDLTYTTNWMNFDILLNISIIIIYIYIKITRISSLNR